ncbi:MAG: GAF domain-containing sensor histidine kinase [bacterium]|nr:GAF domain-containing sensor histidine kinase [bacterium]
MKQPQSTALAVRQWIVLGLRWLGLIFLGGFVLLLQSQASVAPDMSGLVIAFGAGVVLNIALVGVLLTPNIAAAFPFAAFFADIIIVAGFTQLAAGDPLLLFLAVGLGIAGSLIHDSVMGAVLHVIGVLAAGLISAALATGSTEILATPGTADVLPLLLGISGAAVIAAYLVEQRTTQIERQLEQLGQRRMAEVTEMRERVRMLYDISYTMGLTLKYNQVLESALEAGRVGLRFTSAGKDQELIAAVLLFHAEDSALHVVSGRRLTRSDARLVLKGKSGLLSEALREAVPVFGTGTKGDPELSYFVSMQYCRSIVCVPLRAAYDNFGVLVYASERLNAFNDEHTELLTAIGVQVTIALQNAVLYQNLVEEKERIIEIEDDARRKLASDLHDGPTQNISAMAMRVNYIVKLLEKRPEGVAEELHKLEDLARRTSKEIRQVLFTWRPLVLESHGLQAALLGLAEKVQETHGQKVQVRVTGDAAFLLDRKQQVVIFHIVEEALNNARKHANAALVSVSLYRQEEVVILQVMDNGQGFDMNAVGQGNGRNSLGMINMRERAELIEGTFNVESAPGRGTLITVVIPLKAGDAAQPSPDGVQVEVRSLPRRSLTKLALAAAARVEKSSTRDSNH